MGPLMLLLFVNDMQNIASSNVMLFVEDTSLWRREENEDNVKFYRMINHRY